MDEFVKKVKEISAMLDTGRGLINEEKIIAFENAANNLESGIDKIMEEGRDLRLGIVGEVKAGKSSFLNALIFDGEDILPKAPTPMTAALTKIGYSETPSAIIHFYNKNDWNAIVKNYEAYNARLNEMYNQYRANFERERSSSLTSFRFGSSHRSNAAQQPLALPSNSPQKANMLPGAGIAASSPNGGYRSNMAQSAPVPYLNNMLKTIEQFEIENMELIPAEYRACKEVYDMTLDRLPDFERFLGRVDSIKGDAYDTKKYLEQLNEYVGANGRFTSIVKYTEIRINNKMLEGVEIIDTPGLNDPILSRSRTTRKFLIECDAVFLMSYCGQFLGAEDMSFIMSSLPGDGINEAVLIGSKFDSAILQYPRRDSFKNAYLGTARNVKEQAVSNLNDCQITDSNYTLISKIKESLPPYCVSSIAYTAAKQIKQSGAVTGEYEKKVVDNFKKRFPDFNESYLLGMSSITDVRDKVFKETRANKDKIVRERIDKFYDSQRLGFSGLLEEISVQAKINRSDLQKYDKEELENRLNESMENLDKVRLVVKDLFSRAAVDSAWRIKDLSITMRKEMYQHDDIEVRHDSETKHHKSTSGHLWWKKESHWDEVIHTNSADILDAEKNIRRYRNRCLEIINNQFKTLLKIEELKNEVKSVVMIAFNSNDKDFDENTILSPLKTSLSRISIPQISIDMGKYNEMLDSMLSGFASNGVVKNEHIPELKRAQDRVLQEMSDDFVELIEESGRNIGTLLEWQGNEFVDSIASQLEENMKNLRDRIATKEESLVRFDKFVEAVGDAKKVLRKGG
ncbi:MAG: dynamin family protein [Clostridia bacterium]|nr:dynamin family protein [Clostridia bacterium]